MEFFAGEATRRVGGQWIGAHVLDHLSKDTFPLFGVCHSGRNDMWIMCREFNLCSVGQIAGRLWDECAVAVNRFQCLGHNFGSLLRTFYTDTASAAQSRVRRGKRKRAARAERSSVRAARSAFRLMRVGRVVA